MTLDSRAPRRPSISFETAKRFLIEGFVLFASFGLFVLYAVPMILRPTLFVPIPNVLTGSVAIIIVSMGLVGPGALRRTSLDFVYAAWPILAIASHLFATTVLGRLLPSESLYTYLVFILSLWASFRAGFALVRIAPRFGPVALMIGMMFMLFCSAALGILQGIGPFRQAAVDIALRLTSSSPNVLEGAMNGRPTGIFGGPNILGFANCIGSLCLIAVGTTYARVSKPWHVFALMATLGVFGYSTLLSQSRTSLVIFIIGVFIYGLSLRRLGASRPALATYVVLCLVVGGLGMAAFQMTKLTYVEATFNSDITKDQSFLMRQQSLTMAANIAVDVAPLGTGVGQVNQVNLVYQPGYDRYWTIGVDNEWINMYLAHGVLGPTLIAMFFYLGFRESLRAQKSRSPYAKLMGMAAILALSLVLLFSVSGVRIAKYDTGIYLSVILGGAFAASSMDTLPRRRLPRQTPQESIHTSTAPL